MVDIENEVFNRVAQTLRKEFEGIQVYGERLAAMSKFPAVILIEDENSRPEGTKSLSNDTPLSAQLMYTAEIYSNKSVGKKTECKNIRDVVASEMNAMGFNQTYSDPTDNIDRTIFRYILRFTKTIQFYQ